jgi:hypothetical protein
VAGFVGVKLRAQIKNQGGEENTTSLERRLRFPKISKSLSVDQIKYRDASLQESQRIL